MRRRDCAFAILIVAFSVCCHADSAESVRTALPSQRASAVLPVDIRIGQTASEDSSESHMALAGMLREPYSFEWAEMNISGSVRPALARLYGSWLAGNLGREGWLLSVAHANPDGSVGIMARLGESVMSFVLLDGRIVSMADF